MASMRYIGPIRLMYLQSAALNVPNFIKIAMKLRDLFALQQTDGRIDERKNRQRNRRTGEHT